MHKLNKHTMNSIHRTIFPVYGSVRRSFFFFSFVFSLFIMNKESSIARKNRTDLICQQVIWAKYYTAFYVVKSSYFLFVTPWLAYGFCYILNNFSSFFLCFLLSYFSSFHNTHFWIQYYIGTTMLLVLLDE